MERTYVKIDLDAVRHNAGLAVKKLGGAKLIAVIKADAYGHGAVEVARALSDMVEYFGVAIPEEAVQLRRAGITKPLFILGSIVRDRLKDVLRYDLMPSVSSLETAEYLSKLAVKAGKTVKVHIGVDTGMGRIGFLDSEKDRILAIKNLPGIEIAGVCTHYACADERDKASAKSQSLCFSRFISFMDDNGLSGITKHISNSAGIIEFDGGHFDMARSGIMTYGLYPSNEVDKSFGLKPAMSWYASVSHVKTLPEGRGVSYGHTFVTKRPTKIATVPIGYADGYPRALSNRGRVLINGVFAPIVGRVCMDQFMVDVTDADNVEIGSEVVLVGEQGGNLLTVEELADAAYSFNYEFVCGIGLRVPRIYYRNGKFLKRVNYLEKIKNI